MNATHRSSLRSPNASVRPRRSIFLLSTILVLAALFGASLQSSAEQPPSTSTPRGAATESAEKSAALSLQDGDYRVEAKLTGGSGRVSIESPVAIRVSGGKATATIIWTSSFYEYMKFGEEKILPSARDKENDTTTFHVALSSLEPLAFIAQTSKMSRPYDIEYTIVFDAATLRSTSEEGLSTWEILLLFAIPFAFGLGFGILTRIKRGRKALSLTLLLLGGSFLLSACGEQEEAYANRPQVGPKWKSEAKIEYAQGFRIDYYDQNAALIRIKDKGYLLIDPDTDMSTIKLEDQKIRVLKRPSRIYLAAPSAMAFIHDLGCFSSIAFSGTKQESWGLDYAAEAMEKGELPFAGKYNAPDFERLVDNRCDLAVFSTMITHVPDVEEKLEEIGIPVFTDYSSYEGHPLGRTEWIKVYGAILGQDDRATELFNQQKRMLEEVESQLAEAANRSDSDAPNNGAESKASSGSKSTEGGGKDPEPKEKKTVAFFSFSPSGRITARRHDDYVAKMIELSGANYAYAEVTDVTVSALSIIMEPELFFKETQHADIIVYNATVGGGFQSLEEFSDSRPMLRDFAAVRSGQVWVTKKSFYQSTTSHGKMLLELHRIVSGEVSDSEQLEFFEQLK